MVKRLFDLIISFVFIIMLLPLFFIVAVFIKANSKGPVFYKQSRVGLNSKDFIIFKFRSMYHSSDKGTLITIGNRDTRITSIGYFLRKYKIDELPQLINVLLGEMSLVGPRPEVRKYVDLYTKEQTKVLGVKPGITDYASVKFFDENEILAKATNPHKEYIEVIMPVKLRLNLQYIEEKNFMVDMKIILKTILKVGGLVKHE